MRDDIYDASIYIIYIFKIKMHRVKHYFERILNNLSTRGRESLRENRRRVVGCWKIRMRGCNERERTVVKMRKKKFKARYTLLIGGDLLFVAERNFVGGLREPIVVRDRRGWENVEVYTRLFPCCYRWKKKNYLSHSTLILLYPCYYRVEKLIKYIFV